MRKEKLLLLDEMTEMLNVHESTFLIMQYNKISANAMNGFRNDVAKMGGDVQVMRKRILSKAVSTAGINIDSVELPGHIGIVFGGKDPIETTKAVFKYSKENGNTVSVLGGMLFGCLYDAKQVETISTLPSMDGMRSQLLSVFEAPLSQTVGVMNSLLTCILFCLENKSTKES